METIKIRASLVRATKSDCFTRNYEALVNKMFFWKCPFTGNFKHYYRIQGNDICDNIEIERALLQNSLYRLTNVANSTDFCFKLILEPATLFDFFEYKLDHKSNVIYYIKNGETVTGPHITNKNNNPERIKKGIENGYIYIPSKQQTFEQIENKQIA